VEQDVPIWRFTLLQCSSTAYSIKMNPEPGMDFLQGINDAQNKELPEDFTMPSMDKILEVLNQMDMPEEERKSIIANLMDKSNILENFGKLAAGSTTAENPVEQTSLLVFFLAVTIIGSVLFFFSYKLYTALNKKEQKSKGKRKQKELKKKKK